VEEIVGDFGIAEAIYLRIDGGNQLLAVAAVNQLADVRMCQPVQLIESDDTGVTVTTQNDRIPADGVVVAVPLPLISKIRFAPLLSTEMTFALEGLAMGTAAKLAVSTESEPLLLARQDGDTKWWCWTGAGSIGKTRKVVTAFAGTQSAIDAVSDGWRHRIAEAIPEVSLGRDSVTVDWGQEEWSQGCYSALAPGDEVFLDVFSIAGRLVFAGEHTLGAGSIDGAIKSGQAAASRLSQYLTENDV
jgi:monoamine oxidase